MELGGDNDLPKVVILPLGRLMHLQFTCVNHNLIASWCSPLGNLITGELN